MQLVLTALEAPIRADTHGYLRVGQTRVLADLIIGAYQKGLTAEVIADQFPAVSLAQVYTVIAYYLQHQTELDEYLRENRAKMTSIQEHIDATQKQSTIRTKVLETLKNSNRE